MYPLFIFSCQEVESDNVVYPLLIFILQEVDADNVVYPLLTFIRKDEKYTVVLLKQTKKES